jgi:cytochrome c553
MAVTCRAAFVLCVKQLKHFKAGDRQNPLMMPMAAPLSDEDMADLAAYFGAQHRARPGRPNRPS